MSRSPHPAEAPLCETQPDDTREWRLGGQLHREDGPAFERADGYRSWFVHGQRHREDGPAVEGAYGTGAWWAGGRRFPWSLPTALFAVPEARDELAAINDPVAQRAAALAWADRVRPEVWQQACAEALADEHARELRLWGLRTLAVRASAALADARPVVGAERRSSR